MTKNVLLNPITDEIKSIVRNANVRLLMAVPFISSFAKTLFGVEDLARISDKRLVTRMEDCNLNCFELSVFKYLIENGFQIRYNNLIHLKLYLNDNVAIVTSSNLTQGGLESNVELSVKIVQEEQQVQCIDVFEDLWASCSEEITLPFIELNWNKYLLLKKRTKLKEQITPLATSPYTSPGNLDPQLLLDKILDRGFDYSGWRKTAREANKKRDVLRAKLMKGFSTSWFYAPAGDPQRYNNLFYDFVYGEEKDLAGTGLREAQFKAVFEHPDFKQVIEFILPETIGQEAWNLSDDETCRQFCEGLFSFQIPQYSQTMPIRLASYFHPDTFLPVFVLAQLQKMCKHLGLDVSPMTAGDQLYTYNNFLLKKLHSVPEDNNVKSHIAYQHLYTYETYLALSRGKGLEQIKEEYPTIWERALIDEGIRLLTEMQVITNVKP